MTTDDEIVARWSAFRRHTDACDECERVRRGIVRNAGGTPPLEDLWEAACGVGRGPLEAWHAAVREAVEERHEQLTGGQVGMGIG